MSDGSAPFSSVRLSEIERKALLKIITIRADASPQAAKRGHTRYMLPSSISVVGELEQPGGSPQRLVVSVRELSRGGLSLLHGGYLHVGTRCVFRFFDASKKQVAMAYAKVVRCQHVKGQIHDVGTKFDMPLEIEKMLGGVVPTSAQATDAAKPMMYPALQAFVDELSVMVRDGADISLIRELLKEISSALDQALLTQIEAQQAATAGAAKPPPQATESTAAKAA
jgi:hypothetical protein